MTRRATTPPALISIARFGALGLTVFATVTLAACEPKLGPIISVTLRANVSQTEFSDVDSVLLRVTVVNNGANELTVPRQPCRDSFEIVQSGKTLRPYEICDGQGLASFTIAPGDSVVLHHELVKLFLDSKGQFGGFVLTPRLILGNNFEITGTTLLLKMRLD